MEALLNMIFNLSMIVISIAVVCLLKSFKEDDGRIWRSGLFILCIGLFSFAYWIYKTTPICSACETRMADRRDVYCSVCGDIWDENDLLYWEVKE